MLEGGTVIKSARTGQSSRGIFTTGDGEGAGQQGPREDAGTELHSRTKVLWWEGEGRWTPFLNIWGWFDLFTVTLKNNTKRRHRGHMFDVHFVPQTGSNPHLGSRSETVSRKHPGVSFHLSLFCQQSHLRVSVSCPHYLASSEDHRTRCTGTLPVLEDKIAWNLWILDSTSTQTIVVGSRNASHTHSGSAAHMWRDRQSFQVINPWLSGWPKKGGTSGPVLEREASPEFVAVMRSSSSLDGKRNSPVNDFNRELQTPSRALKTETFRERCCSLLLRLRVFPVVV